MSDLFRTCIHCGFEFPVETMDYAILVESYEQVWLCSQDCMASWAWNRLKEQMP